MKNSLTSLSKTWRNESLSLFNRVAHNNPISVIRKRFGSSKTYDSSDPLHAYPNSLDLVVHNMFQKLSRFEVNNADSVRRVLRLFRVSSIFSFFAGVVGLVLALALPAAGVVALGRREDKFGAEETSSIDWDYVNHAAQTVIQAIQSGQLKYEL